LKWLHKTFNLTWFEFLGTTLRDSDGNRCALYLYRDDGGSWYWLCYWLGSDRGANYLALGVAE
jgi:hypothetical protein